MTRPIFIASICAALAAAAPAAALEAGTYACFTPANSPAGAGRFVVDGKGGYAAPDGSRGGAYRVSGYNVTFSGGVLDGYQALVLPDGRLKTGKNVRCGLVEAAPPPAPPSEPAEPPPPAAPAAKLIKVKPD